ncbi:iron chelate uptake ABC transporter family permease subunit [Sphingomonas sp. LR61]|uniref:iron chelate uptake ABC transporter family permease subunit n=1 Tax=Sphingomonas sp. LR61 TaxID=3050234 RepID=UPI003FA766C8
MRSHWAKIKPHSLGVRMGAARVAAIVAVVLLSGGATAAAGPISFVGLLVPHTLRLLHVVDVRTQTLLACHHRPSAAADRGCDWPHRHRPR